MADKEYVNTFITFYTLRQLWKEQGHAVSELYSTIGINRTLYDKILRMDDSVNLHPYLKRLEEITGINQRYFSGEAKLQFYGLTETTWVEFIELRKNRAKGEESSSVRKAQSNKDALRDHREEIGNKILAESKAIKQSEAFRRLAFFAEYKCKRGKENLMTTISQIEHMMESFGRNELSLLELPELESYREAVRQHLGRIEAICIYKKWE